MKPVYMINGFLESGKTEFIRFTLGQQYFQVRGKTLLILCEEGENEYEPELLRKSRTEVELVECEEDFNPLHLAELEKKHKPERIVIEFNGMWNYKNARLPRHWKIEQQITIIDGSTFPVYYTNMRSLLAEMIRKSEMIIFNRCDTVREQLNSYKRNIKAVNASADVIFEDSQGEIDEIFEEDLPYDLNQETIVLDNQGYGIWYLDSMDHLERYVDKKLQFVAMVLKPEGFPEGYFVPGRMAMTCCADDTVFLGFLCKSQNGDKLRNRQWLTVTAKVKAEARKEYSGEIGPVLYTKALKSAEKPEEEMVYF